MVSFIICETFESVHSLVFKHLHTLINSVIFTSNVVRYPGILVISVSS